MRFVSIRLRLAAWYFVTVAFVLGLFGVGAWAAMRHSVLAAVDRDLGLRLRDVREFIDKQLVIGPKELNDELGEEAMLGLGGVLFQLLDEHGQVLYRSARLGNAQFPAAEGLATRSSGRSKLRMASESVKLRGRGFTIQVAESMEEFDESPRSFRNLLLILSPVFLLLASAGGYWISTRALAPVDRITQDARSIGIARMASRLQVPEARDELRRLTETLNEMLDRLDAAVRRMVQFTADASHELRAPLTLIHTAAEFSLRRERSPDELVDAMRKILRESERTSRLVDELLLLARADSGTDGLTLEPVNITDSGRTAVEQISMLAEPKGIAVSREIPNAPVMVDGDEQALARLWLILLDNAVKYTNDRGQVTFSIRDANSQAEVLIADTGVGIAKPDLPFVYDRFWRADKVRSRNGGGAGLGLSIARSIVDRHGGKIEIESEAGQGCRVFVRLPLRRSTIAV
jgi:heavy metal sensor kinase